MTAGLRRAVPTLACLLALLFGALWADETAAQNRGGGPWVEVIRAGAAGDGRSDDTAAILRAIEQTPTGGVVFFPPGRYRVTGEILIDRPVSLAGAGRGSQILQASNGRSLFHFRNVQAISVRDLYLGSVATSAGASLIKLVNTHHSRFDQVIMAGGYYGIHLQGSLLNTFTGLRSGINIGGFFAPTSTNQVWVMAERFNNISANANTFVAPALEGGTNGMLVEDPNSEGSVTILGGTIEGVARTGLELRGTGLPSVISGVHFEANGTADIKLEEASRTRIESVFATKLIEIRKALNTTVENALVEKIVIHEDAVRTRLDSVTYNLSGSGSIEDQSTDTQYQSVSDVNPTDWFGTVGLGVRNPNSNPAGLTPDLKLDVDGVIRAKNFSTGDIIFRKDGRPLWRMFEDERGLQLEDVRTGQVSKVMLERDAEALAERLGAQEELIRKLQAELAALRQGAAAR
jgi:hypothetical protein